jgi:hypothetical protein
LTLVSRSDPVSIVEPLNVHTLAINLPLSSAGLLALRIPVVGVDRHTDPRCARDALTRIASRSPHGLANRAVRLSLAKQGAADAGSQTMLALSSPVLINHLPVSLQGTPGALPVLLSGW